MFGINLSDEDQAKQVKDWLKRYGWYCIIFVAILGVSIGGYRYLQSEQRTHALTSGTLLQEAIYIANTALDDPSADASMYATALEQIDDIRSQILGLDSDAFATHIAHILQAQLMVAVSSPFNQVERMLQGALDSDYPPTKVKALVVLANAAWSNGDTQNALALLQQTDVPHDFLAIIDQLRGEILLSNGDIMLAKEAWGRANDAENAASALLQSQLHFVDDEKTTQVSIDDESTEPTIEIIQQSNETPGITIQ